MQTSGSGYSEPYYADKTPQVIDTGQTRYITIDRVVTAESAEAMSAVQALNALNTRVREEARKISQDYPIFPLEGVWDLTEKDIGFKPTNITGKFMIKQPLFLNEDNFTLMKEETIGKFRNESYKPFLHAAKFQIINEGKVVQMLHIGSYSAEASTFEIMEQFARENNLTRVFQRHHHREIYLKDIQQTPKPEHFETILRFQVR